MATKLKIPHFRFEGHNVQVGSMREQKILTWLNKQERRRAYREAKQRDQR